MTEVYEIYVDEDEDPNQVLAEILEEASRQQKVLMPNGSTYRLPLAETYPRPYLELIGVGIFEKTPIADGYGTIFKWVMVTDWRWKEKR